MKQRNYGNVSQEAMQVVRLVRFHLEVCRMVAAWRYKRWHFHPQDTSTRHLTLAATLPCCLRLLWQLNMVIFYYNLIYRYNIIKHEIKQNTIISIFGFYLVNGIHGNRIGPTIITVNGVSHAAGNHHNLDSLLYTSMDEPQGRLYINWCNLFFNAFKNISEMNICF